MHTLDLQGARLPALGFGTWQLAGQTARDMVSAALSIGYRAIDTARMYGNEIEVGAGLKQSGVPRDEIFLTDKIWPDDFRDGDLQKAAENALRSLDTDYVDLLLLHWPNPEVPLAETMEALADVARRGLARHVGVSNFPVKMLREAVDACPQPLFANQVEYHPFLDQRPVIEELARQGMALIAYSPIAQGKVVKDDLLRDIAAAHGKTPVQVALRWLIQQGCAAIPRSSSPAHAESNFAIFDFTLSDEEMHRISSLRSKRGRLISPAGMAPAWD